MKYEFSICRLISISVIISGLFFSGLSIDKMLCADLRSLVMAIGLWFFLMLFIWGADFIRFIGQSLICLICTPTESDLKIAQTALFGSRSVISISAIVALLNMFELAQNIPSIETMVHVAAGALLPILYGLLLSEIFLAIVYQSYKGKCVE